MMKLWKSGDFDCPAPPNGQLNSDTKMRNHKTRKKAPQNIEKIDKFSMTIQIIPSP